VIQASLTPPGHGINSVELGVVLFFFVVVTIGGFIAARWKRGESLHSLDEWGLGGRRFGTVVTWFLLGGDLYTAYTFVAVPAAMFSIGSVSGFFAVPYTIVVYPLIFVFMPKLWSVSHRHGYVTPADFVKGRYDSRFLSLAIAVTGIVATMPYIALQLVGIQAVVDTMGLGGKGNALAKDLPLIIAFVVLAAYTYSSGLRAPAMIAFVKDSLIYIVIIVAVVYIAWKVGFGNIFDSAQHHLSSTNPKTHAPYGPFIPPSQAYWAYTTLALGSAMALFMYPHSVTGVLAANSRKTVRRNAAILPAYSLMLGFLALIGFAAIHAHTSVTGQDGKPNAQLAAPHWFAQIFPDWFAGIALAAIGIGALVPAAIMAIAAANLFTRNIYRDFIRPQAAPKEEALVSKIASLVVKFGALAFVLTLNKQNALNFQLLGGVWIMQTFLAIVAGLYTRWFHRWALLIGWAAAIAYGTYGAYNTSKPGVHHFASSVYDFPFTNTKVYLAVSAIVINIVVSGVLTILFRALRVPAGTDGTTVEDYYTESRSGEVSAEAGAMLSGEEGPTAQPA
jgi:SSS family solute:Na+ symporter